MHKRLTVVVQSSLRFPGARGPARCGHGIRCTRCTARGFQGTASDAQSAESKHGIRCIQARHSRHMARHPMHRETASDAHRHGMRCTAARHQRHRPRHSMHRGHGIRCTPGTAFDAHFRLWTSRELPTKSMGYDNAARRPNLSLISSLIKNTASASKAVHNGTRRLLGASPPPAPTAYGLRPRYALPTRHPPKGYALSALCAFTPKPGGKPLNNKGG